MNVTGHYLTVREIHQVSHILFYFIHENWKKKIKPMDQSRTIIDCEKVCEMQHLRVWEKLETW